MLEYIFLCTPTFIIDPILFFSRYREWLLVFLSLWFGFIIWNIFNRYKHFFKILWLGDKGVFNIEAKNYIGDLTIDEEGNWYRVVNGQKFGTENPVFQVKRHNKVLNNILESKIPIIDLIVWTNVESIIEGAQYSPVKVLKVDQLTYFIESFNGEEIYQGKR